MSQTDAQFKLRLPHDLLNHVKADALANNRSVNAEIVKRLGEHDTPLRDWFAGQALPAIIESDGITFVKRVDEHAALAYAQADAMLKAREAR